MLPDKYFKTLALKYVNDIPETQCALYSNLLSSYELDNLGTLKRSYSPIQVLQLKGTKDKLQLVSLNHQHYYSFSDISTVKLWLQDFKSKKIDIELIAHCSYRKKSVSHVSDC